MTINSVIHTNQHSIERVLQTKLPVVLVFWSRSALLSPQVETLLNEAAQQHTGHLLVAKVDAESEVVLRQRYHVDQLPALVLIKAGQENGLLSGSVQPEALAAWLQYMVGTGARPTAPRPGAQQAHSAQAREPITLTDRNFQQTVNSSTPVLVDFWAPWCGPCRMVAPSVDKLAQEFQGRAVVGKLNVDENPQTAQRYGIQGIPALLIFKNGQVIDRLVGAQPFPVLQQHLNRAVQ